jgi:hypothetical protein
MATFTVISSEQLDNSSNCKTAFSVTRGNAPAFAAGQKAWALTTTLMQVGTTHEVEDSLFELEGRSNDNGNFRVITWK